MSWDQQPVLDGHTLRLEPADLQHADGLAAILEMEFFRYFLRTIPADSSPQAVAEFLQKQISTPGCQTYVLVLKETGQVVGSSSYTDMREADRTLEIGMTYIGRAWQGTQVNPEAKLLMLCHAFGPLGCQRVQLKTDERNLQSQAALQKLGAHFEGCLRKQFICWDGFTRNTMMYSILAEEWPEVRSRLDARLKVSR